MYIWAFPLPFENGALQHGISSKSSTHVPSIEIWDPGLERTSANSSMYETTISWKGIPSRHHGDLMVV